MNCFQRVESKQNETWLETDWRGKNLIPLIETEKFIGSCLKEIISQCNNLVVISVDWQCCKSMAITGKKEDVK